MSDASLESWEHYYQRTQTLPPSEKIASFLAHIPEGGRVLDFGAGSGRWTAAFLRDRPDLFLDALDQHIEHANLIPLDHSGQRIASRFEDFSAPSNYYDGILAFAALFFLPPSAQASCFAALMKSLKPRGVMRFTMVEASQEARSREFYGCSEEALREQCAHHGLTILIWKRVEDIKYGATNSANIPTFFVTVQKP